MSATYNSIAARVLEIDFLPIALLGVAFIGGYYLMTSAQNNLPVPKPDKCQLAYQDFVTAKAYNLIQTNKPADRDLFFWQWCRKLSNLGCFDSSTPETWMTYCSDDKCSTDTSAPGTINYPYDPVIGVNWQQYDGAFENEAINGIKKTGGSMIDYVADMNAFCAVGCYKGAGSEQWNGLYGPPASSCWGGVTPAPTEALRCDSGYTGTQGGSQTCVDTLTDGSFGHAGFPMCGTADTSLGQAPNCRARCACNVLAYMHLGNPVENPNMCPVRTTATGGTEIAYTEPTSFGSTFSCPSKPGDACPVGTDLHWAANGVTI